MPDDSLSFELQRFLLSLRGMRPFALRALSGAALAARGLSGAAASLLARPARAPSGPVRWALAVHLASSSVRDGALFELWRRASGFPRPGFSRSLPPARSLGHVARLAMAQASSSWSDLECRRDWLRLLSLEAERLALGDPRALPTLARAAFQALPLLARHGEPGRHFLAELDARAPGWREAMDSGFARAAERLRGGRDPARGLAAREALMAAAPLPPESTSAAEALARDAIARARDSSRASGGR